MFKDWLRQSNLSNDFEDQAFKIEEVDRPDDFITRLAKGYLDANVDPSRIDRKVRRLKNSSRDLGLDEIEGLMEEFIKESVLPDKNEKGTKSGLFGEYMSEKTMIQINGYSRFIYKLRHREASNWAPKLIDICVFKNNDQINLCLIEVKTNSSGTKNNILEKGLESLLKALKRK